MSTITFTVNAPPNTRGKLHFAPRAAFTTDDGDFVVPGKSDRRQPWLANTPGEVDLPNGPWEVGDLVTGRRIPFDVVGDGDLEDLIVFGIPNAAPVTTLQAAVAAWLADNPLTVDDEQIADAVEAGESATRTAITGLITTVGDSAYAPSVDDAPNAGLDYGFAVGYPEAVQLSESALDAQYAKARAMGAKRIRIVISPADTGSGAYVWTRVDRQFTLAAKNGLTPHVLFEGPRNAGGTAFVVPTTAVMTPLITAAVARYKDRCSVWEVLNEVNHVHFWGDLPSPSGYKAILQAAYTAIHAAQPQATVVTAGLMQANDYTNSGAYPSLPDGRITVNPVTYLTELYAAGAQGYFDAVGNHPYTLETGIEPTAPVPSESSNAITRDKALYDLMVANGDAGKQIWWTEVGFPTTSDASALGFTITQAQQRDYLRDVLSIAAARPWVGPVLVYTIQDLATPSANPENVYGQYTSAGVAKESAAWWQTVSKPIPLGLVPPSISAWSELQDKPAVIAAGADAAAARAAIGAVSPDEVTAAVNAVLDGAPGALDTLNELAAALGDDPSFAATVTTALGNRVTKTDTANRLYGTDNAGAQATLALSASADSWTVAYRDGSGRVNVNTPSDPTHAVTKAYVDGSTKTGVFQFEHCGVLNTLGSAFNIHTRRPFAIPHAPSRFRVHFRNRNHLGDTSGGNITGFAAYIGVAAKDGNGVITGNFAATPTQIQTSTTLTGTDLVTGWISPGTFQIDPYTTYLISMSLNVAAGQALSSGGGLHFYTGTPGDAAVASPAGLTRVDNQGYLEVTVEYEHAEMGAPTILVVSNSISGGGNTSSVANRAEMGAWQMLWAMANRGSAASIAVGGSWAGSYLAASQKWSHYDMLNTPLAPDAVVFFATASSDICAGSAVNDVKAFMLEAAAKARALYPTARIIVTTNPPRVDSTGTPETNRLTMNRWLAGCMGGAADQCVELNGLLSNYASPERIRDQYTPVSGTTTDPHWNEAAHSAAAAVIPVRYGARRRT